VGRTIISPTSTSAGCSIANAAARAIASGGMANLSRDSTSWVFTSGFVTASAKFVWTKPGEMIVTRSLSPGLLPQTFGDGAHGELRAGIDRLVRFSDKSCRRSSVNEMSETLLAEDRQRCGDAVEHTFDVDVDHLLPILDAQVVETGNWHSASIAEENVKPAVTLTCQLDEVGYVVTPFYVCACIGCLATRSRDTGSESLKAVQSARAEYDLRTARSAIRRAVASPIPLLAPVITTTLPSILFFTVLILSNENKISHR
jgi:hypothetical protein